jgi:UPF0271 protein
MGEIDLNADLGEGFDDGPLLEIVTSANVACGFHAGSPSIMRRVCEQAAARGVAIGAHVSYPDRENFGRRFIDIDPTELRDAVTYQLGALSGFCVAADTYVSYVKPHGALYNAVVDDEVQAQAVIDGVREIAGGVRIFGLPHSALLRCAEAGELHTVREAFVDRAYNADGTLVDRTIDGSVLHDVDEIVARAVRMATVHRVVAIDGAEIDVPADSLCVHGDTPGAVAIAAAVRAALESAGVTVRAFTPSR